MTNMTTTKKQIAIWMTPEEYAALERVKESLHRKTNSDTLRVLVLEADKKFLSGVTAMAEGPAPQN